MNAWFQSFIQQLWKGTADNLYKHRVIRVIRGIIFVFKPLQDSRLPIQAGALSYYTLIALGPLIAVAILLSSFILHDPNSDVAVKVLGRAIHFIAPPAAEYSRLESEQPHGENFNPQLVELINRLAGHARSGTAGVVGSLILIAICIQLIASIENTLNGIWGIEQGRSWGQRILIYWAFLSLGSILGFASISMLSAATCVKIFNVLPYGESLLHVGIKFIPLGSYTMIWLLLATFYRYMPNTVVRWAPALYGAAAVCVLLALNNRLAFLYVSRAIGAQSLYGSIAIVPVLMFGLYIFWLFILLGGQITYVLQNFEILAQCHAWEQSSPKARELFSLALFLKVARRFVSNEAPYNLDELTALTHAPAKILNPALAWLRETGWISAIEDSRENASQCCFQINRPLHKMTLLDFHQSFATHEQLGAHTLQLPEEPLLPLYMREILFPATASLGKHSLLELLEEKPQ